MHILISIFTIIVHKQQGESKRWTDYSVCLCHSSSLQRHYAADTGKSSFCSFDTRLQWGCYGLDGETHNKIGLFIVKFMEVDGKHPLTLHILKKKNKNILLTFAVNLELCGRQKKPSSNNLYFFWFLVFLFSHMNSSSNERYARRHTQNRK